MNNKSPNDQAQRRTASRIVLFKSAALAVLQLLICLLPLVLCSCRKETGAGTTESTPGVIKMSARGSTVSVVSVGDISLGGSSSAQFAEKGYDWPFEHVRPLLGHADLVIGNLAAPITARTKKLVQAAIWRRPLPRGRKSSSRRIIPPS